jgi:hypothetical protein
VFVPINNGNKHYVAKVPQGDTRDMETLDDELVKPGIQRWEIISWSGSSRMWQRVFRWSEARTWDVYRLDPVKGHSDLDCGIPYELVENSNGVRTWKDLINGNIIREPRLRELAATEGNSHFEFHVKIQGMKTRVMMDSGAMGNFINPEFVQENDIPTVAKRCPYQLTLLGGKDAGIDGWVRKETKPMEMLMPGGHMEVIVFDLIPLGRHYVVLGTPWIRKHNPDIDWVNNTVDFGRCTQSCK